MLFLLQSCSQNDTDDPIEIKSNEALLLKLELEHEGDTYTTTIDEKTVSLSHPFPFASEKFTVKTIEISPKASINIKAGDVLFVNDSPVSIEITAEDEQTIQNYELIIQIAEEVNYAELLFEQYTDSDCEIYATKDIGDLKVENNAWNANGLPLNSYLQCIYIYDDEDLQLLGWKWAYPDNAYGVNAYPQLIYGWKPWQASSTTEKLPKKISDIAKLKVSYEVETTRNDGDYNLAFDNWINSSSGITPQNILFEFMIWEDANNLLPFGDFQEEVSTTNGTYKFYLGEPDWEPEGSNWTYLAFQRKNYRTNGTVDIDELISYLLAKGIISQDHYLASVELGNEVGNSRGQTIIKKFAVELE